MTVVNLFLPITPYTLFIAEKLITSGTVPKGSKNILVNPHNLKYNDELWNEVYADESSREVNSNKIKRYFNFYKQIVVFSRVYKRIKKYKNTPVNYYYVDIAHVLSNAIFFDFNNIQNRYVIEDGLLNYYELTLAGKMLDKKNVHRFLRFFKLKTQKFDGHITGIQMSQVNNQFVFFPSLAFKKEKSLQIPYDRYDFKVKDRILVIGQEPIINYISPKQYLDSLGHILDDFKASSNGAKFYYKPHHHGVEDLAKPYLEKRLGDKLVYLKEKLPIHDMIQDLEPKTIISFGSTASLNLKLFLPVEVSSHVYLLRSESIAKNENLESLFENIDISIKELHV